MINEFLRKTISTMLAFINKLKDGKVDFVNVPLTKSVFEINPPVLREKMHDSNKQEVQMKNVTAIIRRNRTGKRISW